MNAYSTAKMQFFILYNVSACTSENFPVVIETITLNFWAWKNLQMQQLSYLME